MIFLKSLAISRILCTFVGNYNIKIKQLWSYWCFFLAGIVAIIGATGEDAERFVREAEENERNPQRRKLLFSFEDIDRMMERSRKYLKEHGGKGPFAK